MFCEIWAAVDVLCCTSSILSLCVISLDRYIGVTRPLAYSTIMAGRRTSLLIVLIWTASFAISIGPLLGWREPPGNEPYYCTVNTQLGYVFFSATGSFYLPMLIILSVYWKIYKAAMRQTKFLESGQKTTKQDVTLRIHMGGTMGGGYGLGYGNRAQSAPDLALVKVTPTKNGKNGNAKNSKESIAVAGAALTSKHLNTYISDYRFIINMKCKKGSLDRKYVYIYSYIILCVYVMHVKPNQQVASNDIDNETDDVIFHVYSISTS